MKGTMKGAANTAENLASDVGNTAGNLASNLGNTTGNLASNLGNTLGGSGPGYGTGYNSGGLGSGYNTGYGSGGLGSAPNLSSNLGSGYGSSGLNPGFSTSGNYASSHESRTDIRLAPNVTTQHIDKPVIVRETVLPQEKIEVQPIIHREREMLEVHEVVQPMHEKDIAPTLVKHATLPAQVRQDIRESDTQFQAKYREASSRYSSEVQTQPVTREFYNKAPIIEEHISKKIIEEVQPVLYKETITPTLIEETQPIYEKIVEAPTIYEEMRETVELGTKIQPLSGQFENLNLNQQNVPLQKPTGFQRETYVTKEYIPAEDFQKLERNQIDSKRIV